MKNFAKIEKYIKDNANEIQKYKINVLAKEIGVSTSAITRFCKQKGYNGFNDIKEIVFSYKNKNDEYQKLISSVDSTYKNLNIKKMKYIAQKIFESNRVYILGESFTFIQGTILERKLTRINIDAKVLNVASDLSIILPKNNVVYFFITHSGKNNNIKNAAKKIYGEKNTKKFIFSVTAFPQNNIKEMCNEYLFAKTFIGNKTQDKEITSTAFITTQIIIDALYKEIYDLDFDKNNKILKNISFSKI